MNKRINANRVKLAREYRGLSGMELADSVGITRQTVHNLESGKDVNSAESLIAISRVLDFPVAFFYEKDSDRIYSHPFFRSSTASKKKEKNIYSANAMFVSKIFEILSIYIQFPEENLPELDDNASPEEAAKALRIFWGLDNEPLKDLIYTMESNGIILSELDTSDRTIDAFNIGVSSEDGHYYVVVLNGNRGSAVRRNFDCAHELGHIILNHTEKRINADNEGVLCGLSEKEIEEEAHRFAGAFLLPEEAFLADLGNPNKLQSYVLIKPKWRVSIAAMIVRAYKLKAINYDSYQNLMKQISGKGWRFHEPFDDEIIIHRPGALKRSIELLVNEAHMTPEEIIRLFETNGLSMKPRDYEKILKLAEGTLSKPVKQAEIVEIKEFLATRKMK